MRICSRSVVVVVAAIVVAVAVVAAVAAAVAVVVAAGGPSVDKVDGVVVLKWRREGGCIIAGVGNS